MRNKEYVIHATQGNPAAVVRLRCPFCRHVGAFEALGASDQDVRIGDSEVASIRRCPVCLALVFVVYRSAVPTEVEVSYPPEVIDFDTTGLPESVINCLDEALICQAQECYRAAAIMIRRTLEEVCADQGATGDNLGKRLTALAEKVMVPSPVIDGLADLRLLGNDAAHVEAKTYEQVGRTEVEVAIEVTKLVLQAVYQMAAAMALLDSLKQEQNEPPAAARE